jgi:electron transfer flavoprotein beta subunit
VACVLVHIEAEGDRPTDASLGALGAGRRLASRFGAAVYAVVLTSSDPGDPGDPDATNPDDSVVRIGPVDAATLGKAPLVDELSRGGADKVVFVTVDHVHRPPLWANAGVALAAACAYFRPLIVVVPTSRGGHDLAARLAARLGAAYMPDAVLDYTGPVAAQRRVYATHIRRWVLDDLDRAAVIGVAAGAPPVIADDDAEVMLLAVDVRDDLRVLADGAPPPRRRDAPPDPALDKTVDEATAAAAASPSASASATLSANASTLELPVPPNVAVLVRGLLAAPGLRAQSPLGTVEQAAVAAAVAIGRARGVPVTAIAAGASAVHDRALAAALAAGCARAIRIDAAIADEVDYLGLAQVLAQAVRKVDAGVIVCGDRATDEATGAIGPAVAELIDAAHLTAIDSIDIEDDAVVAHRGAERLRVRAASVLCLTGAVAAPAAAAAESAPSPPIELLSLEDLGLDSRILAHRQTSAGAITSGASVETLPGIPVPDFGPEPP